MFLMEKVQDRFKGLLVLKDVLVYRNQFAHWKCKEEIKQVSIIYLLR